MAEVKLISVEPSSANEWCKVSHCYNDVESRVELKIGSVAVKLLLCEECKIALLKEVSE